MATDGIRLRRDGAIAVLTLDRPERKNAIHEPMWRALREAGEQLAADPPRVLLLHGAGDHFSSGMDLYPDNPLAARLLPAVVSGDEPGLRALIEELKAAIHTIARLPCVVIAAIEGACVGAGLEFALAADLRVAAEGARFALLETRFGMVPDIGGTVRLARLVGRSRATDLVLTARQIGSEEAHAWGLVDRRCPDGAALATAETLARSILDNAPTATREALAVLRAVDTLDDTSAFEAETVAGIRALRSGEVVRGIEAFAEKRRPRWDT